MEKSTHLHVFIYGGGGREHALTMLAAQSFVVERISCFPGNPGIMGEKKTTRAPLPADTIDELVRYCQDKAVDLVIIGPEKPLADGWADRLRLEGIPTFGPNRQAARIESDKAFAKELMNTHKVPTAPHQTFRHDEHGAAAAYVQEHGAPIVVKANGLCAGKGVTVCDTVEEALEALQNCFVRQVFGPAGDTVVIEDLLVGHPQLPRAELSVIALVDIHGNFVLLPAAQDYKRCDDGDQGLMTGSMGSFCPLPWLTPAMLNQISQQIIKPTIRGMYLSGALFAGALYAGLIWTEDGPKVVEFNCRFGDPETQAIAMMLETDIIRLLKVIADGGSIAGCEIKLKPGAAVCGVLASAGYPGDYEKGAVILGVPLAETVPGVKVFHAGTALSQKGELVTAGGRVLGLTCRRDSLFEAADGCRALGERYVYWRDGNGNGILRRTDIGFNVPTELLDYEPVAASAQKGG